MVPHRLVGAVAPALPARFPFAHVTVPGVARRVGYGHVLREVDVRVSFVVKPQVFEGFVEAC